MKPDPAPATAAGATTERTPPPASVRDVARLAGVSITTVSRALNSPGLVEPETLARIRDAVKALRYVPRGAARALRSRRSFTIGAVVPALDNAFFANATNALQEVLDQRGYTLLIGSHRYDPAAEVRITRSLVERGAEGLVFVGADHDPELFVLIRQMGIPYVLTWATDPSGQHPFVGFDNRAATGRLARHLLDQGHRSFGVITAPTGTNDRARERVAGVRGALESQGIALDPRCVVEMPISLAGGREGMRALLAPGPRPTAVICINDVFAVGAITQCQEAGLDVPGDVSVAGFGDMEIAGVFRPGITTIRTPTTEMGRLAAESLVASLGGESAGARIELEAALVIRASTGPAPRPA
ncbi:MAG TPA: LacI family DNA-binding transcriptional regulator [Usitatibacteraceae bacterium]|jgi:LacI family transcriptional regulator|nr:LacI family DNA-binding transcriptional regulator [Burkholderiales bacterium]HQY46474.1 LacI family DNA-binding transcriptional regulator [Usitatibacteraceae bacterium]HRA22599.1 LacI family DNA-binding transcriptional regulator [Usitatibacteraceae bacterium]